MKRSTRDMRSTEPAPARASSKCAAKSPRAPGSGTPPPIPGLDGRLAGAHNYPKGQLPAT
eukprot:7387280-Prymnesium_polylepis.1